MKSALIAIIAIITISGCSKFTKVQKSTDYEYKLRMAEKYYIQKKYHNAQMLYEELFPIYKGDPKFEDIFYKYAYCSYHLKDWMQAENLFKQFVEVFPSSPKAEEMEYMRAYTYFKQSPKMELDQTNTAKAIGSMQTFINTHPGSPKIKEATDIIDQLRAKLEVKDYNNAQLYYNMGHYRAAAIAYSSLMNDFPDSQKSDEYKLQVIKAYYLFADNSVDERKAGRYEQVITECNDFTDRFPESKLMSEVQRYSTISRTKLNNLFPNQTKLSTQNEQVKKTN